MSKALAMVLACVVVCGIAGGAQRQRRTRVVECIDIDTVPSWFPVGFSLLTHEGRQYVAYYNARHEMIVASRKLDEKTFRQVKLPTKVGWDSHNFVTMAVDDDGFVHLSGNMHCAPLIYFRMEKAGDIGTFKRLAMTGKASETPIRTGPCWGLTSDSTSCGSGATRRTVRRIITCRTLAART
ncbi:MAG: BNR-4 repeat-containing protein [Planctomycetes bacterium]|nr:BNR-4 repeat-containing protein [Planctomycetota bacterium]